MSLRNQNWITFGGEPVTGRTPTQVRVSADTPGLVMNAQQEGFVAHAYKLFCDAINVSAFPNGYHIQNRQGPDGTTVRMESNLGVHRVFVKIKGGDRRDDVSIGIILKLSFADLISGAKTEIPWGDLVRPVDGFSKEGCDSLLLITRGDKFEFRSIPSSGGGGIGGGSIPSWTWKAKENHFWLSGIEVFQANKRVILLDAFPDGIHIRRFFMFSGKAFFIWAPQYGIQTHTLAYWATDHFEVLSEELLPGATPADFGLDAITVISGSSTTLSCANGSYASQPRSTFSVTADNGTITGQMTLVPQYTEPSVTSETSATQTYSREGVVHYSGVVEQPSAPGVPINLKLQSYSYRIETTNTTSGVDFEGYDPWTEEPAPTQVFSGLATHIRETTSTVTTHQFSQPFSQLTTSPTPPAYPAAMLTSIANTSATFVGGAVGNNAILERVYVDTTPPVAPGTYYTHSYTDTYTYFVVNDSFTETLNVESTGGPPRRNFYSAFGRENEVTNYGATGFASVMTGDSSPWRTYPSASISDTTQELLGVSDRRRQFGLMLETGWSASASAGSLTVSVSSYKAVLKRRNGDDIELVDLLASLPSLLNASGGTTSTGSYSFAPPALPVDWTSGSKFLSGSVLNTPNVGLSAPFAPDTSGGFGYGYTALSAGPTNVDSTIRGFSDYAAAYGVDGAVVAAGYPSATSLRSSKSSTLMTASLDPLSRLSDVTPNAWSAGLSFVYDDPRTGVCVAQVCVYAEDVTYETIADNWVFVGRADTFRPLQELLDEYFGSRSDKPVAPPGQKLVIDFDLTMPEGISPIY